MTKIAKKIPGAVRRPVYISETEYEIYYALPISLGRVVQIGKYWYTSNGHRFLSSREAMSYLVRHYDETGLVLPAMSKEIRERLMKKRQEDVSKWKLRRSGRGKNVDATSTSPSKRQLAQDLTRQGATSKVSSGGKSTGASSPVSTLRIPDDIDIRDPEVQRLLWSLLIKAEEVSRKEGTDH